MMVRSHCESAAFYRCGRLECNKTNKKLTSLTALQQRLNVRQYSLNCTSLISLSLSLSVRLSVCLSGSTHSTVCVVDCTNSNVYVLSLLADFIIDEKRLFNSLSCDLAWVETRVGLTLTKHLLHPANGLFSRTTWVSRFQKCKTSLDLHEARDDGVWGWQWHQLDHMQTICTSLQTDNHTNTSSVNVCRPDALPDAQPTVSDSLQASSCQ